MNDLPGRAVSDSGVRVTLLGTLVNVILLAAKLLGGILTGSIGLIADGMHSGSDLATDLVVLGGIQLGRRKPDSSHPYGHGRYETIAGGVVAAGLIIVGAYLAGKAGAALYSHRTSYPGFAVIIIAVGSILAKEWIARLTLRAAARSNSTALRANAWHHRSDALSSMAVLLGGIGGMVGFGHADQIAGIVVGLMVIAAGAHTIGDVLHELSEGSLSLPERRQIEEAIIQIPGVRSFHNLRTRRVGREVFVDLHVLVDPGLSVLEGHRISMQVEDAIKRAYRYPVNVLVHVEPDTPELIAHNLDD